MHATMRIRFVMAGAIAWSLAMAAPATANELPPARTEPVHFLEDVRPLLSARCYECHGPDKQKGGLRLDDKRAAMRGGDSGPSIVPGTSAQSLLLQRVAGLKADEIMPPKGKPLSKEEVSLLRGWIEQGAPWPDEAGRPAGSSHWAFQPLHPPNLPAVDSPVEGAPLNPVDRFVRAKLKAAGLRPSRAARRETLIRRLTLDLHGLPPRPDEIDAFVRDSSPRSYEALVDRLLASPRYGERWARHWLDVARYTESQGFEYDKLRDNAWHYRDYLIESFNRDKPYDQFMREQIAGDVLDPRSKDALIATSLLVCGPWDEAGNSQANATQKAITREEEMEDLVGVVGQTFLGLTVNCARCHSHKFDPIPQEEYYRVRAVFDGIKHGERVIASEEEKKTREERLDHLRRLGGEARERRMSFESLGWKRWSARVSVEARSAETTPPLVPVWKFAHAESGGALRGGAVVARQSLVLDRPGSYFQSDPLDREIREKTLEAWVALDTLDQRGGGVISIEKEEGRVFDAIVFGERQERKWIAGSSGFERTRDLEAPEESTAPGGVVHMAAVYGADGTIALFRNGEPYGKPYKTASPLQSYPAGTSRILLGMRHSGGGNPYMTGILRHAALYDRALSAEDVRQLFRSSANAVSMDEILSQLSEGERAGHRAALEREKRLRQEMESVRPSPVSYVGARVQPAPARFLKRGDVKSPGDVVRPGALSVLLGANADFGLAADAPEGERRRRFADWLADPANPLPARVMVNRVWQWHFGQALVSTPNDFGSSGSKPTHPELLDWLACFFRDQGWSLKALHRVILLSATYRQDSHYDPHAGEADAENGLLWRFAPRRLEAEVIRDSMLTASGEMNWVMGGPSFRPFEALKFPANAYVPVDKTGADYNRRTVYRMNVNSGKEPLLDALDCPDPSVKTPRRGSTTTPLQALGLMNNSFVLRQARRLAERCEASADGRPARAVDEAYRLVLGRRPTEHEAGAALVVARERGLASVTWALFNSTEFVYAR